MAIVPEHLAIILDGNGRWAKKKGLPRNAGHVQGAHVLEDMCEIVWNKGIKYLTVYAFSSENWKRPADEVALLMKLLRDYMKNSVKRAMKNNMRVRVIGDKSGLDEDLRISIAGLEEATKDNTGLNFTIALNYGGRDEIVRAVRKLSSEHDAEFLKNLSEEDLASALDTAGMPDPDLLIRTCGEERLSNFLLWQLSYSEFYFADCAWPDFTEAELDKALESYASRTRRFGGLVKGEE
ncbi:MAG: isoprenyl transferase [Lachnospiraceae bacterium]|nr:isoprenyl transferase [Lachnospiraceae bacterium]